MASRLTSNLPPSATPPNAPLTHVEPQNRPTVALTTLNSEASQNITQSNASMTAVRPDLQKEVDTIKSMAGGVLHVLVKQDQEIKEQHKEIRELQQKVPDLENQVNVLKNESLFQDEKINLLNSQMRSLQIEREKADLSSTIKQKKAENSEMWGVFYSTCPNLIAFGLYYLNAKDAREEEALLAYIDQHPNTTKAEAMQVLRSKLDNKTKHD